MLPDHWERELDTALHELQQVVNDELAHQFGQLGESLRDFLYDLFNYPLERPWPESLAIFAEHWTDRGLRLTPRTLDALGELIAEELGDGIGVELAEAPAAVPEGSPTATDAILQLAQTRRQPNTTDNRPAENGLAGYEYAARRLGRSEQLRLALTDDERKQYESYVVQSLLAEARGEPPIPPPLFWHERNGAWLEKQSTRPRIYAVTKEQQEQSEKRWKWEHIDELPLEEQRELRFQALMEARRQYAEKYGLLAAFLNPAFDGSGTLNDWTTVVSGLGSSPPPGLDLRNPRPNPPAAPQHGRRSGTRGQSAAHPPSSLQQRPAKKPGFPPPVSAARVTIRKGRRTPDPRHVVGAAAEEEAARSIHSLPNEVVILWGQKIGAHGPDVVSYNLTTRVVTLWDVKWRGKPVRLQPTKTFEKDTNRLDNALKEAAEAVEASKLSKRHKDAAIESINRNTFQTRTLGAGHAKNSAIGDQP